MVVKKFLRRDAKRFLKFGKGKGKKATYRKPTGRDNKMREKKKGYAAVVSIGYGTEKKLRGMLNEKIPIIIMNINDLKNVKDNMVGFVGKVGNKKKQEIVAEAKKLKIELKNVNVESFLKKLKKAKGKEEKPEEKKKDKK